MTNETKILETSTADFTSRVHHAMRRDGAWFCRYQERSPWGYRWGAWQQSSAAPEGARETGRWARLPKAVA